ncbi:MAG: hypothetical protein A4E65_02445 [Syntrophorhabdus sp. PtaU1.Bin153]|nr:MAG: hypothetical protein A4E65_02445 [Syntrophorhabdus sp. PtaU1.Bin153]
MTLAARLDAIVSIASAALQNESYEPGRRDLEFFIDSVLDVVDGMREEAVEEEAYE